MLSHTPPANTEVISYLFNNFRNKFNTKLQKPNSPIEKFIPVVSLDFSFGSKFFTMEDTKILADCLRNNTTIKTVALEYCGIDDAGVRYFADIFWFNKVIEKFSLANNNKITTIGIKTLLNIKKYNNVVKELIFHLPHQSKNNSGGHSIENEENSSNKLEVSVCHDNDGINIFDNKTIGDYLEKVRKDNLTVIIKNKNLAPNPNRSELEITRDKDANKLLQLFTESYNEIIGKGTLGKVVMLFGMDEFGKSVLCCQLSDLTTEQKFTVTELDTLKSVYPDYDEKIRHNKSNKDNQDNQNNQGNENNQNDQDSRYKLVNNFLHDKEPINILECSAIHNTAVDPIQKILDLYAYWQIFRLATEVKFGIVVRDNSADKAITSTIKQFTNIFKDQEDLLTPEVQQNLQGALFYIVTLATGCETEEKRNNKITKIKKHLESLKNAEQNFIISQLVKSIHLFKKAIYEEPFLETLKIQDLVGANNNSKWSTLKEIYIAPFLYEYYETTLLKVLSELIDENITVISKIIKRFFEANKNFIIDPIFSFYKLDLQQELTSEMFSTHYNLLKDYLPQEILSEAITSVKKVNKTFFPALQEIKEFKDAYNNNNNDSFEMVFAFLEIIRKFSNKNAFQKKLGEYI